LFTNLTAILVLATSKILSLFIKDVSDFLWKTAHVIASAFCLHTAVYRDAWNTGYKDV